MRRLPFKNNLQIGSWYIGAGNKPSVISQKPAKAFSKIKEAYRDYQSNKKGPGPRPENQLSEVDKEKIRNKLRKYYKKRLYQKILSVLIAIILTIGLLWVIAEFTKERINAIF